MVGKGAQKSSKSVGRYLWMFPMLAGKRYGKIVFSNFLINIENVKNNLSLFFTLIFKVKRKLEIRVGFSIFRLLPKDATKSNL